MAVSSGKYYSDTKQGNCFSGTNVAAGTTFPLSTGTAMTFGLWNVSTTKNAVLQTFNSSFTSGTLALGELGLTIVTAGQALGTPITAFTDGVFGTTIRNNLFGSSGGPVCRFTPTAATIAAAAAAYWFGVGFITASTVSGISCSYDFDGRVILGPGQAAFLVGSIAQTALFTSTLSWQEVPA